MSISFRTKNSPSVCGYPVGDPEVVEVRWDFAGCILGCDFCSSPAQQPQVRELSVELSPAEVFDRTLRSVAVPSRSCVRFSGGEPTLYWNEVLEVLRLFAEDETLVKVPVVIKTNGISIGNGTVNVRKLTRSPFDRLKVLFELSIKGSNPEEFELLTRTSAKLYPYQMEAYKMLKNARHHNPNLSFVCLLGAYHSSEEVNRSKFVFVYPQDDTPMFDKHKPWDKEFQNLWSDAKAKWVLPLKTGPKDKLDSVLDRCGSEGAGLIKHYPEGVPTNPESVFHLRPSNYEYIRAILDNKFWQ
jgi:uncharacterized Fe-S cluster-containing radical SAM superfamily protein